MSSTKLFYTFYAEGGATGHTVVRAVCLLQVFLVAHWKLSAKTTLTDIDICSDWVMRDLLNLMAVASDQDSSEDQSVHSWQPYN